MQLQLKQEFDIIKELRSLSGFGWDDERKVVTAEASVWDAYIEVSLSHIPRLSKAQLEVVFQKHPKAKPWRKKPFPLYDEISELIDGTRATGHAAFRATASSSHTRSSTSSSSMSVPAIDPNLDTQVDNSVESDDHNTTAEIPANPAGKKEKKARYLDFDSDSVCPCPSNIILSNSGTG